MASVGAWLSRSVPLQEGERVRKAETASLSHRAFAPGRLFLTDRRLIWSPWLPASILALPWKPITLPLESVTGCEVVYRWLIVYHPVRVTTAEAAYWFVVGTIASRRRAVEWAEAIASQVEQAKGRAA